MTVRGLTIWGDPLVPNNDGMDIDSSTNVHVSHTHVSALDDAICIKTDDGARTSRLSAGPPARGLELRV